MNKYLALSLFLLFACSKGISEEEAENIVSEAVAPIINEIFKH